MSESGASLAVDLGDVWTAITDVAETLSSEASFNLANNGFVLPRAASSADQLAGWHGDPHQIEQALRWGSTCSDWGICSPTRVRLGMLWYFGGRLDGRGRYIGNADVYAIVESLGLGQRLDVEASFDNPMTVDNYVAQLSGQITVEHYYMRMLEATYRLQFQIRGDGAGRIWFV